MRKKSIPVIIAFFLLTCWIPGLSRPVPAHEFHISKCLIEYNETEKTLQVTMHLFLDDLEEALRRVGADKLFLCTEREDEKAEIYLERYLQQHLRLKVNQQPVAFQFLGKEISDDLAAVWCYLEVTGVSALQQLAVTNDVLLEVFDDQKNIVNIIGPKKKKGVFLFQKGQISDAVSF